MPSFPNTDFITSLGPAFMARRLKALSDQFVDDIQIFLTERGLIAPARGLSALMLFSQSPGSPVTQLAEKLGLSHPLMINLLNQLEQLGLVRFEADASDRRRRLVFLTSAGEDEVIQLKGALPLVAAAYADLGRAVGLDIWESLEKVSSELSEKPWLERLREAKT